MADLTALKEDIAQKSADLRRAIEAWTSATGEIFTPWAPHLSDTQLLNCRVLQSRYHIIDNMPKNAVCAEVGSQAGNFAVEIIKRANPKKLHILDWDLSQFQHRETLRHDIESGRVEFHEGDSPIILNTFDDHHFDWIYIDGDHSYNGFTSDLEAASRKLRPNGYIVCNDYTVWSPAEVSEYGILRGVHEFCVRYNWEFVFIGLHGQGYHDVCLRKRIGEIGPR